MRIWWWTRKVGFGDPKRRRGDVGVGEDRIVVADWGHAADRTFDLVDLV